MNKVNLAAILIIFVYSDGLAANANLSKCSEIKGNVERLQCFDEITKVVGAQSPVTAVENSGDWTVQSETSKINDNTNVFLNLKSKDNIVGRSGDRVPAELAIICREGETDILFYFAGLFMTDNENWGRITFRADKQPAFEYSFTKSTNNKALGLWRDFGLDFIKSLYGVDTLLVRATPFNESSITTEFHIAGLKNAIQPLTAACKW